MGIGQEAIKETELYCRKQLGANRIWLDVYEDNEKGNHIYEKLGYERFKEGKYGDEEDFRLLSGELSTYAKIADSGRAVNRMFCPTCSTPVCWTGEGFPGIVLISLSSLDNPEAFQPVHEGWTDRAVSWCRIREDIQSFPRRPVREE